VREVLYTKLKEFDPRKLIGPARDSIREVVKRKMRLFGSSGRA
jgi:fructose-bisphosphate aldolase class II